MADDTMSNNTNTTLNSTFKAYFRQFAIYVIKNPYEFLSYLFMILTPLMLICGILSWKLIQMMEQEKKDKKRKNVKNANTARTRRKKAKPE